MSTDCEAIFRQKMAINDAFWYFMLDEIRYQDGDIKRGKCVIGKHIRRRYVEPIVFSRENFHNRKYGGPKKINL